MGFERLANLRSKLRASLWFFPLLAAVLGFLLGVLAVALDRRLPAEGGRWGWLLGGGAEGAASLLSTLAGSIITVTGVVFSITIVTLSLASSQFGPRLLRNFMRDRFNQTVLGTFIGTFLYCLAALVALDRDSQAVPWVVILGALVLTLASIVLLIIFLHHVSMSIQAETVLAGVSGELQRSIDRYYPDECGEGQGDPGVDIELPPWEKEGAYVRALKGGYVESVALGDLLRRTCEEDFMVRVLVQPGDFVVAGATVMEVWPADRLDARLEKELARQVLLGKRRTEEQDVEFALDQLVEVAVRALSTGVNDPFTATTAIDHLTAALCRLGGREIPSPYRYLDGRLRLIVKRTSYRGFVDGAFDPLRQYGSDSVAVLAHLLGALEVAIRCTPSDAAKEVLRDHATRIMDEARAGGHLASDLADLERRCQMAIGSA